MLVNPYIEGTTPKVFKADNSLKGAKIAYETLSEYFNNSVHNFRFTLLKLKTDSVNAKNGKTNKFNLEQYGGDADNKRFNPNNFSHFTVSEKINKNKTVDYEIKPYTGKIENLQHLINNVMSIQQKFTKAVKTGKKMNRLSESPSSESADSDESVQSVSGSYSGSSESRSGSSESGSGSSSDSKSSSNQLGGNQAQTSEDNTSSSYQIGGNQAQTSEDNSSSSYQIGGNQAQTSEDNTSSSYQIGGKKSKYDDEDDDDSPDYYVKKYYNDPIAYWYYYPSLYSLDRLYLPTFVYPLSFPYILDNSPVISYNTSTIASGNPTINIGL